MKKVALIMLAAAFLASVSLAKDKAPKAQKISGWVTDAKCASVKGSRADHADCAKKCLESGMKAVFVTDSDNKILTIENADAIKGHEGHHVRVTGHVTGDSLHVDKVAMLKAPKTKA
ncbi:MAG TPA: hypothetical protein VEW69_12880 [Alphaproteobacteria bacterium]|nr:hypothetical protein [Alphaproteobacteria bacterium]